MIPELIDKVNEFTKQYSVGNIFDVSITEVLDKEIEIQTIMRMVRKLIIVILLMLIK
jgi:hypothetical protein